MKVLFYCVVLALSACSPSITQAPVPPTATGTKSPAIVNADSLLYEARKAKGLPNVTKNPRLKKAAQAQTLDMIAMATLTHKGSNGSNSRDRMRAQGYKGCFFAENIAKTSRGLEGAFDLWMTSTDHRNNIQNRKATEYGIYGASGYWTLVLASPC
ncbi:MULTISPECIES: CAP domain-containing protein [Falsihalocynthiibacter]|uniref:CAP domain-containing protein n=1 Tax=Falsihalocynthiibacter TaxID=2854182 RepID=UPI0030033958